MEISGCGTCLYGANSKKYPKKDHVECMLNGYIAKNLTDKCSQYKKDYKKSIVVTSETKGER